MLKRAALVVAVTLLGAAAVGAGSAGAAPLDSITIQPGSPDPWSDPGHHTAFEQLASTIASSIVGRPTSVRCENRASWAALNAGGDPDQILGLVKEPPHSTTTRVTKYRYVWAYRLAHGKRVKYRRKVAYTTVVTHADTYTGSADTIELSPQVCGPLQQFGEGASKPTKCAPNGAPIPCFLGTPAFDPPALRTDSSDSTCYATANEWPDDYYDAYDAYAQALLTLAHESIHVIQGTKGNLVPADTLIESQAECSGMQRMADVAMQLGDTPDDAQAVTSYVWLLVYPGKANFDDPYSKQRPYWSADCKPGGPLDVRPAGSTAWP